MINCPAKEVTRAQNRRYLRDKETALTKEDSCELERGKHELRLCVGVLDPGLTHVRSTVVKHLHNKVRTSNESQEENARTTSTS